MSDSDAGVVVEPQVLAAIASEIADIDVQLDATSRGKRAIGNQILAETQENWSGFVSSVRENVSAKFESDSKIGVVLALRDLVKDLEKDIDDELSARAEEAKKNVVALSDEDAAKLNEHRKELLEKYKAVRNFLVMFNGEEAVADIPVPKTRRGSSGKRAPRILSQFQYALDGDDLSSDNNSLSYIATREGVSVSELKAHINAQGVSTKKDEIPNEWEVTLASGTVLSASRFESFLDDDSEEDSDDESDE